MDNDIETTLVSVVKEEVIEIKEEPLDEFGHHSREERMGDLGQFYQVDCKAETEECLLEEEMQQKCARECPRSKEIERLEARVGRLECLLELLVSKVVSSPQPRLSTPSPAAPGSITRVAKLLKTSHGNGK